MNRQGNLRPALSGLAKLQIAHDKKGGPEQDGEMFEYILSLQSNILKSFGLPEITEYMSLLCFETIPTEEELNKREKVLHNAAKSYLLSNAKSEIQILKEAAEQKLNAFNVLPHLNISNHNYTHFVYYCILLPKKDTVANVWKALQKAQNNTILNLLGYIVNQPKINVQEEIKYLNDFGITYINEFIDFYENQTEKKEFSKKNKLSFFLNNELIKVGSLEDAFAEYARFLMNDVALVVADTHFRITECEVYYHCPETHPDPYVHKRLNQLETGRWYFNDAGLDITFGNREKGIFASYLIRAVAPLDRYETYIHGPIKVVREIFSKMGEIDSPNNGLRIVELKQSITNEKPYAVKRFGLRLNNEDKDNYLNRPYRYFSDLSLPNKFPGKENVIRELIQSGGLTIGHARHLIGYDCKN